RQHGALPRCSTGCAATPRATRRHWDRAADRGSFGRRGTAAAAAASPERGGDAAGGVHPAAAAGIRDLRRLDRRVPLPGAAEAARPAEDLAPDRARERLVVG